MALSGLMAERGVVGKTEDEKEVERGVETASPLSITLCGKQTAIKAKTLMMEQPIA